MKKERDKMALKDLVQELAESSSPPYLELFQEAKTSRIVEELTKPLSIKDIGVKDERKSE